ncbi:polysaccharide biosynthesis tyrosine autokinase [uncultured Chloroflexus sp.]|uniref:polysaccharide biosynthesis tyrosine autokinase n=1 Tax=uncultured Chloroflexus sp. TaxID=214040 RepID=UPI0026036AF4|nr:polysaccharide biosynthesis tyrosine autokinase [uncultured Chloroflexus sp.]
MELKQYLLFVWRWIWLIILFAVIGASVGFVFSQRQPPQYVASTMLMVNQNQGNTRPPTFDELRGRERYSLTVRQLLLVRPVLERAAAMVGNITASQLLARASITEVGKTELFLLTVQDTDRQRAVALADAIVTSFQALERDLLDAEFAEHSILIVVDPAYAEPQPVGPNYTRNIILSVVIAILIAIAIGFLYDYFNTRINDEDDLDRRGGGRPLLTIGTIKGNTPAAQLITLSNPAALEAESYRTFRLYLDRLEAAKRPQVIAVISAAPGEGRSLTAANLAVALAQTGRRVVLVDANLRNPTLHTFFNLPYQSGLTNLLRVSVRPLESFLQVTPQPNLYVLTAGMMSGLPAQLLGCPQLETVLATLRQSADVVIIDTAPLFPFADTALLLGAVDATLLVVRANHTNEEALRRTFDMLSQTKVACLGVVLNGVKRRWRWPAMKVRFARSAAPTALAQPGEIAGETGD